MQTDNPIRQSGEFRKYIQLSSMPNYRTYVGNVSGGTVTNTNNQLSLSGSLAYVESKDTVPCSGMDPIILRFSLAVPAPGTSAEIGIGNYEEGIFFNMDSTGNVNIKGYTGGTLLKAKLTITATATGTTNVTLGGVTRAASIVATGNTNTIVPIWGVSSAYYRTNVIGSVINYISPTATASDGTYSISGSSTGTINILTSGVNPTTTTQSTNYNPGTGRVLYEMIICRDRVFLSIFNTIACEFSQIFAGSGFPVLYGLKPIGVIGTGATMNLYNAECSSTSQRSFEGPGSVGFGITSNIGTGATIFTCLGQITPVIITTNNKLVYRQCRLTLMSESSSAASGMIYIYYPTSLFRTNYTTVSGTSNSFVASEIWNASTVMSFNDSNNFIGPLMNLSTLRTNTVDTRGYEAIIDGMNVCYIVMLSSTVSTQSLYWTISYNIES